MIKKALYAILAVFILIVLFVGYLYFSIQSFGNSIKPKQSDVIIVLGAAVWGDRPSPVLRERCDWAYNMYKEGYAKEFILSGGRGNENLSEAQAMKDYLMEKGVPEQSLHMEEQSHSTLENMRNSVEMMKELGLHSALIVTNKFHLKRAFLYGEKYSDFSFSGYGENTELLFEPYFTLREVGGLLVEYFKI